MARHLFGQTVADFTLRVAAGGSITALATAVNFYSAKTGGTHYTDLQNSGGGAITSVTSNPDGTLPTFYGPDGVVEMWADAGGSERVLVQAHASATYSPIADASHTGKFGVEGTGTDRIPITFSATVDGPTAVAAGGGSNLVGVFTAPQADGDFTGDTGPDPGYWFGHNQYTVIGSASTNTTGLASIIGTLSEVAVAQPGGTLPVVFGHETSVSLMGAAAGATITQAASLHVAAPARRGGATGGSIGTAYGLKVDSPTIGGANFSIYAESGAPARFMDRVDVAGNISNNVGNTLTIYGGVTAGAALELANVAGGGNAAILLPVSGSSFLVYASGTIPLQAWRNGDASLGASGAKVGFLGASPIVRPTVTGSRGGNAALASALTALANLGLITDSSS